VTSWESIRAADHSSRNALNKGNSFSGWKRPERQFPFIRLVVTGSVPIERDPKHAAHAAHASDPSVLDASSADK
jgi:hypothetical protein